MKLSTLAKGGTAGLMAWLATTPALAELVKAPTIEQQATMVNKGDTAWMLISSALVLMMSVPALALFYGGLVRTKNMLSVLMQVFMIVSVASLVWCCWGYTMAFTSAGSVAPLFVGGFSKAFLIGVSGSTYAATFSNNVYLPEFAFVIFQMTFACITPALIVGAFAERVKFSALMVFVVAWLTVVYFPIAHMVWYWAGPDFLPDAPTDYGYLWGMGALDFAGGTVVHINAGIAGLVGCLMIGKRIGHGKEATPPHSLTMTMIGASLLWVGWFGFNAGSNLEANGVTAVAFHQHLRRDGSSSSQLGDRRADPSRQALDAGRCDRCRRRPRRDHPGEWLCGADDVDRPRPDRLADLLPLRLDGEEQAEVRRPA